MEHSGLIKVDFGKPLPLTASRAKGYDLAVVAVLDSPDTLSVYATHEAHLPYEYMLSNFM
jgi:hypothetical protein